MMATITSSSQAWAWLEFSTTYSHQARLARLGSACFLPHNAHRKLLFSNDGAPPCAPPHRRIQATGLLCAWGHSIRGHDFESLPIFDLLPISPREQFWPWMSTVIGIFWVLTYPPHLVQVVLERPTWHTDGLAIIFLFKNNLVMM